ncbi:MAG TPA: RluA family pseudouridine synthase [Geobacteraceae bacterium]
MHDMSIGSQDHCRQVESFLRNLLPGAPTGYLRQLVKAGHLLVNGSPTGLEVVLRQDDRLSLKESSRTRAFLTAARPALDIIWEDERIVVINKPSGLPMHRTAEYGDTDLVTLAIRHYAAMGIELHLRPVNRLDRGTSGAVILAKSSTSAGMFGRFVKEEGLGKVYLALVRGGLPEEGMIDFPLDGKEAQTRFRCLAQGEQGALTAAFPVTGRTHQIRKHLSMLGHPILGDRRYGGTALADYPGFALHAFQVSFRHPAKGTELTLFAPLPADLALLASSVIGPALPAVLAGLPTSICR